jgi:hypothetical protein
MSAEMNRAGGNPIMISTLSNSGRLTFVLSFLLAAVPTTARAAWEAVPDVRFGITSNDNVLRTEEDERSASLGVLDAAVTLSNFNERGNIFLAPGISVDAYSDSQYEDLESEDVFLRAGGEYDWQDVSAGFQSNYAEESVLRAEFADAVPEDPDAEAPIDPDTGRIVAFDEQRKRVDLGGNLDFRLSPRSQLQLAVRRLDVSYSELSATTFRTDFDDTTVALQLNRQLSELNRVSATVFVSQFNAERNANTTDSVGLEAAFARPLSQTWTFNVFAGVQEDDYGFLDQDSQSRVESSSTNASIGFGFRKRTERSTWNLGLRHAVDPNANGFLTERDDVRVFLRQQFSPRFTGEFGLSLASFVPIDDLNQRDERDYARLQLTFEWAMTRTMFLAFGVDSYRQEFVNEEPGDTSVNSVFVGVNYRGLSRQNQ